MTDTGVAPSTRAAGPVSELFSGSLVVFVGLVLRIGLLMLFELVAARHLGPADYGLFSLAFTWITVFAFLPVLGLQNSLRRFISLHLERRELAEARGLLAFGLMWPALSGVVLGGLLFAFAGRFGEAFDKPELAPLLRALALVVPLWSTRRLATVIFSGYKRPLLKAALEDVTEPGLRLVCALIVAASASSVLTLAYGTTVVYVAVGLLAFALVRSLSRDLRSAAAGGEMRVPWRDLLTFAMPLFVSELGDLVLAWVSVLLLGALSVEQQVGLFRSVSQPPMLVGAIMTSFAFVYLPTVTELFVRDDREGWRRSNRAVARWTLTLGFPVAMVCLFYPAAVIQVLFGADYLAGAAAMQWMAGGYLFRAACGMTGLNLVAAGHTRVHMGGTLLAVVVVTVTSVLWIPPYGATGAAAALALTTVLHTIYNLLGVVVLMKMTPFDARWLGLLAIHLVSFGALASCASLLHVKPVVAMFAVGGLELPLAIAIGLALGAVKRADVDLIARLRAKGRGGLDVG